MPRPPDSLVAIAEPRAAHNRQAERREVSRIFGDLRSLISFRVTFDRVLPWLPVRTGGGEKQFSSL